jgi:type I restriction enzyme S subunit
MSERRITKTIPLSKTTKFIVDNRGRSAPTAETGIALIATNCISNDRLYPSDEKLRFVSQETYDTWFRAHPKPGDILLTNKGSQNGAICLVPDLVDFVIAQDMVALRANENVIDPLFLFAALRSPDVQYQIKNLDVSGVIPHFKKTDFDKLHLPYPDRQTQEEIGRTYFVLSAKIELNRRMNATLEAMARALFQSWFVDPVQDGLPKGWRYASIEELSGLNCWTLSKADDLELIEYIEISEVDHGNVANVKVYQRGEEPSRARRRLRHGDTVLSTVRPDRCSYFLCLHPPPSLIASTGFAVLTPKKAPWSFIHAALTQPKIFEFLGQRADGGAYPAVRPDVVAKLEVPWPDNPQVIEAFHRICAPLYERADHNRRESHTLATLRDTLLPKLLSGELTVAKAMEADHA